MLAGVGQAVMKSRGRALIAAAAVALGLAAVAASHAGAAAVGLMKVRLGGDAQQTRIVMDLDQAATGKLISDGADGRAILVLNGASATSELQGAGQGLVKSWLVDQTSGGARLQMDLAPGTHVKRRFLLPPADGIDHYRYVVDVAPDPLAATPHISPPPVTLASATAAVAAKLRPQIVPARATTLTLKKVIVIDAGHGGHDPGAKGQQGYEKDINLAAARALKVRLERSGRYRVVLTREADVYVPLESRVRIAQRAGADLFLSLHSDSGPEPSLRGASVYTLSDKATGRSARFVSGDDWFMKASLTGDRGVSDILLDLTQRATRNRSAGFAQMLVGRIEGKAALLRKSQRDAGFMVLLAPDVPAVLLEMGFISNSEDEAFLRDGGQRNRLMNAVGDAIDDYFDESTRLASR
jgi:N-acetylmuramoyl-L-alanine amidase